MQRSDVRAGSVLLMVAVAYWLRAPEWVAGREDPGTGFFPLLLAIGLALIGLVILVRGVRSPAETGSRTEAAPQGKAWAALGLSLLYVTLFEPLGFVLSTLGYTLAVTYLFQGARPRRLLTLPPLCTLAIYLFFRVALGVRLPVGLLG